MTKGVPILFNAIVFYRTFFFCPKLANSCGTIVVAQLSLQIQFCEKNLKIENIENPSSTCSILPSLLRGKFNITCFFSSYQFAMIIHQKIQNDNMFDIFGKKTHLFSQRYKYTCTFLCVTYFFLICNLYWVNNFYSITFFIIWQPSLQPDNLICH